MIHPPGKSISLLGPSGAGKSHLIREALEAAGSGVVLMAPGSDEMESYRTLYDRADIPVFNEDGSVTLDVNADYIFCPVDDEDYMPSVPEHDGIAEGHRQGLRFLASIATILREDRQKKRKGLRWKVLGVDTFSGLGSLSFNAMLLNMGMSVPPPAISPEGAKFYGGYAQKMREIATQCRKLKGMGLDWLSAAHVQIKEASKTYGESGSGTAKDQHMPIFTGVFREQFPALFDVNFHAGRNENGYYLLWDTDLSRKARSRYGSLSGPELVNKGDDKIQNSWPIVEAAIQEAIDVRAAGGS
ncbi:hypothetical protein LCGC14_0740350 [marine sediment metagenome]|uniref:Uncharacterized protein n=2 Tax=marine sediment metagenome TaxID=412755 RepID=A0A0F9SRT0_9ZZZZ